MTLKKLVNKIAGAKPDKDPWRLVSFRIADRTLKNGEIVAGFQFLAEHESTGRVIEREYPISISRSREMLRLMAAGDGNAISWAVTSYFAAELTNSR